MRGQPRNTGRTVSEAEFRRMWEDLSISQAEIGRRLGISGNAVKTRARIRQLPDRPKGRAFARRYSHERMIRMYHVGLSMAAIAAALGCREHTVLRALRRAGVVPRDRNDPASISARAAALRLMAASARETAEALRTANMVDYHAGNKRRAA